MQQFFKELTPCNTLLNTSQHTLTPPQHTLNTPYKPFLEDFILVLDLECLVALWGALMP